MISKIFMTGALTMAAIHSLIQDALGPERMADYWVSAWITVPLAVTCLALCSWRLWTYYKEPVEKA